MTKGVSVIRDWVGTHQQAPCFPGPRILRTFVRYHYERCSLMRFTRMVAATRVQVR